MLDAVKAFVEGMRSALFVVEKRRAHYECYRCRCSKPGGNHHHDCPGRAMATHPATFAVLDETITMIEAAIGRVENGEMP